MSDKLAKVRPDDAQWLKNLNLLANIPVQYYRTLLTPLVKRNQTRTEMLQYHVLAVLIFCSLLTRVHWMKCVLFVKNVDTLLENHFKKDLESACKV